MTGSLAQELSSGRHALDSCALVLRELSRAQRHLLEWVVRVVVEVASRQEHNRMNVRNVILVLAPNLIAPDTALAAANPFDELFKVECASNLLHTLAASSMRFTL